LSAKSKLHGVSLVPAALFRPPRRNPIVERRWLSEIADAAFAGLRMSLKSSRIREFDGSGLINGYET